HAHARADLDHARRPQLAEHLRLHGHAVKPPPLVIRLVIVRAVRLRLHRATSPPCPADATLPGAAVLGSSATLPLLAIPVHSPRTGTSPVWWYWIVPCAFEYVAVSRPTTNRSSPNFV